MGYSYMLRRSRL